MPGQFLDLYFFREVIIDIADRVLGIGKGSQAAVASSLFGPPPDHFGEDFQHFGISVQLPVQRKRYRTQHVFDSFFDPIPVRERKYRCLSRKTDAFHYLSG